MAPNLYLGPDGLRAVLVLLAAVAQAAMAGWPDARGWKHTIATRSASLGTPVVPPGFTFTIWGPIFLLCGAFAVWQALPDQLGDPLVRTVGWLAIGLFSANVAWEIYVPFRGLAWPSVLLIVGELMFCGVIAATLVRSPEAWSGARLWFMTVPLLFFAGWASAALFVNLSSTLVLKGITRPDPRRTSGALLLVGLAAGLASAATLWTGSLAYALAMVWAFVGIVAANTGSRRNAAVAAVAGLACAAVLASAILPMVFNSPR